MYLAKRKTRTGKVYLAMDISQYPKKLNEQVLETLVVRLRNCEENASDPIEEEIIYGHIRLTVDIAGRYIAFFPNENDDILSSAFLGLVHAVKVAKTRLQDNNITPFIVSLIHNACSAHIRKIYRHGRKIKKLGQRIITEEYIDNEVRCSEAIEAIEKITKTTDEKLIVKYCLEGLSSDEISLRIGLSRSQVNRIRQNLHERYSQIE
jgi:RNA polymerase sigma factor (sigma-70 family)